MSPHLPAAASIPAKPFPFQAPLARTALLAIDLQRDFLFPGGFGDIQSDTQLEAVQAILPACKQLLQLFRDLQLPVIHTREGHAPDLSDCPPSKLWRVGQSSSPGKVKVIGEEGLPGSRLLIRGEHGHDLHELVAPFPDELVIDKPGKGAFWNTCLLEELQAMGVTHLVVMGVTTECCVSTTVREANDRGFQCCVVEECTAGYNDAAFKQPSLDMLHWSDGLFGYVCTLSSIKSALTSFLPLPTAQNWSIDSPNSLDINTLAAAYRSGITTPDAMVRAIYARITAHPQRSAIFIHLIPLAQLTETCRTLEKTFPDPTARPPLYGIPFSIKDSIDLAGVPTTTACPPLAYTPTVSSTVVSTLLSLGAIPLGKSNLDQLATGLTGCRSPHGIPPNPFSATHIPGGSSSGSAVSVSSGLASFAVSTDTAGSGRVPAGFNGVVGFKPTKGTISFRGVVTACESLDCIAYTARTVACTRKLWRLTKGFDKRDRMAKHAPAVKRWVNAFPEIEGGFRFAVPSEQSLSVCSGVYRQLFSAAVQCMRDMGGELVSDQSIWPVFEAAGKLLYDGTFVTERLAGLPRGWADQHQDELHPVIREIFAAVKKRGSTAEDVYRDLHSMMSLRRKSQAIFSPQGIDVLLVPTAPAHPTMREVANDPIGENSLLGTFTHFGNVLDLCAIAVPAGTYVDAATGVKLPFSVTIVGGERMDDVVLGLAARFEAEVGKRVEVEKEGEVRAKL